MPQIKKAQKGTKWSTPSQKQLLGNYKKALDFDSWGLVQQLPQSSCIINTNTCKVV